MTIDYESGAWPIQHTEVLKWTLKIKKAFNKTETGRENTGSVKGVHKSLATPVSQYIEAPTYVYFSWYPICI